ncbi:MULTISPECIES: DUF2461 domain-containing protein [Kitasatospora]|uniref:TIGR02453 family protein n=1 Tax=Kitasatospora setae (strain ATCC 33774 / DSM 43861 / JCM 3304 / KCC A-0304 / NBRC 14216 / KM-6054) TaxID=452652 RepID=E4MZZ8_KITSK|nr:MULTISPECIES: DUF2461 domain-containing protein [Kitasatospora]BAJ31326.1 hypothetical protein KSE_55510 [Kitasatospora setae KM-6054]
MNDFRGWPAEALEFYEHLEADNSKTFWAAHRAVYDEIVLAPMEALLARLEPEFGPGRVFRPNRDVRFSADKSPYKTNIGGYLESGGYVQLSADGLACGLGYYFLAADQLARYRAAVAEDVPGAELERVVAAVRAAGPRVVGRNSLKTAPRGVPKDHPRIELLRHKGLIAWQEWEPAAWLGTARAYGRVTAFLRAAAPLHEWLENHVGPSELPPR